MGMFGRSARQQQPASAPAGYATPEHSTGAQLLNLLGMNLLGVNVLGQRDRNAAQDKYRAFAAKLQGLTQPQYQDGPGADVTPTGGYMPGVMGLPSVSTPGGPPGSAAGYQPPIRTADPINAADPRLAALQVEGQGVGYDTSKLMDVLKMQQPNIQNNGQFTYDAHDAKNNNRFFPTFDKGQAPIMGPGGQIAGVQNLPGSVRSAADMAGAVTGAQEQQKAAWDLVPVPMGDGTMVTLPRAIAAPLLARNAARAAGSGGPAFGVAQSPAAQAQDVETAKAGAAANVQLPQVLADAQQARDLIHVIKSNPEGPKRTGGWSVLPAIPGTAGAGFDAEHAQLQGKLFMQAYNGLRGGGQITEVEGKKATEAVARLSRAQTWADYNKALDDLDGVLAAGMDRAQRQPGRLQPQSGGSSRGPAPSITPDMARAELARRRAARGQ